MRRAAITDISTLEGDLGRCTRICININKAITSLRHALHRNELVVLIKSWEKEIKENSTASRFVNFLISLGLLKKIGDLYTLSSEGKALCKLYEDIPINDKEAHLKIKIFYFRQLFTKAYHQLYLLLSVVHNNRGEPRKNIIEAYFSELLSERIIIWSKTTIRNNLNRMRKLGALPNFFRHKFGCMERWLREIGLIRREKGRLYLTPAGEGALETFRKEPLKIYHAASHLLDGDVTQLEYDLHSDLLMNMLKEAYNRFKRPDIPLSDYVAMKIWICITLLSEYKLILEEEELDMLLTPLANEGIVKVISGRGGKPAFIILCRG